MKCVLCNGEGKIKVPALGGFVLQKCINCDGTGEEPLEVEEEFPEYQAVKDKKNINTAVDKVVANMMSNFKLILEKNTGIQEDDELVGELTTEALTAIKQLSGDNS